MDKELIITIVLGTLMILFFLYGVANFIGWLGKTIFPSRSVSVELTKQEVQQLLRILKETIDNQLQPEPALVSLYSKIKNQTGENN